MGGCREIGARLLASLEGELPAEDRGRVEAHLAACPACRHEAAELAETLAAVRDLPAPDPSDEEREAFAAAVRARISREPAPRRPPWGRLADWLGGIPALRPVPALAAATALGLFLAVGLARSPRPAPAPLPAQALAVGEQLEIGMNLELLRDLDLLEALEALEAWLATGQVPGLRPGSRLG